MGVTVKKRLSIKDLFYVSWKGFTKYFMHWVLLFGIQLTVFFGFLICCAASLALAHYFFVDHCLFYCALSQYSTIFTSSAVSIIAIFSLFFMIIFPIMYKQNALDLVFKRTPSGFDVNNRFFSYAVAMCMYWIIISCATCFFFFPGLFLSQRWRFFGLHLLDHGGSILASFKASWQMTRGYVWFLAGISMIQWLLFMFCSPTLVFIAFAIALNHMVDANIYKQLHIEYDKDITTCSCEK